MAKKKAFTISEKRVLKSLYRLDRWATTNEVAQWADGMSWNTAFRTLFRLKIKGIVKADKKDGKKIWLIKN